MAPCPLILASCCGFAAPVGIDDPFSYGVSKPTDLLAFGKSDSFRLAIFAWRQSAQSPRFSAMALKSSARQNFESGA
jgi:hypothetical protein